MTENVDIYMKQNDLKSMFTRQIGWEAWRFGGMDQKHDFKWLAGQLRR